MSDSTDPDRPALLIQTILGHETDDRWHEELHHIAHHGVIELLRVQPADLNRRRFRAATDAGTDCAVSLPRNAELNDGAVLYAEHHRAIVLKVGEQAWIRLRPASAADALELGYHAGTLHWRVRFEGDELLVAADGPRATYLERIAGMIDDRRVAIVS
jgi:urease accessory protein